MQKDAIQPDPPRQRPHRVLRFFRKLLITGVVAAIVVVIIVQLFLWSDYPRQIAVHIAEHVTGLRVDIGRLTLGWMGTTSIDQLRVGLPLQSDPFLSVDRIDAKHTALPMVILTQGITIESAKVRGAFIDIRQNASGAWNVQQVLKQIAVPTANASEKNGSSSRDSVTLPDVSLDNARARITLNNGKSIELNDLNVHGHREGQLAWAFDANAGDLADAKGKVVPAGAWPHDVTAHVDRKLVDALAPLISGLPKDIAATIVWTGQRTATGIDGRLSLPPDTTHAMGYIASGATHVTVDGTTVTATPDDLSLDIPGIPAITMAGGQITYAAPVVSADGLRVRFAGGTFRADARADLQLNRGTLTASWEQVAFPKGTTHQGSAAIEAASIWPGKPQVTARLSLLGTAAGGTFETRISATTTGDRWTDATTTVDIPLARFSRQTQVKIEGAHLVLHNSAAAVQLTEATLHSINGQTSPTLQAQGMYAFGGKDKGDWWLTSSGSDFSLADTHALGFDLNAEGSPAGITLNTASATLGKSIWATLTGQYIFGRPEPVGMQLVVDSDPNLSLQLNDHIAARGHISGSLKLGGTATPMDVTIAGRMKSQNFALQNISIGDAYVAITGTLKPDDAELHTEHLRLFDGQGWFDADFPYWSREVHASLGLKGMKLSRIGQAANIKNIAGLLDGTFDVHVPLDHPMNLVAGGQINIDHPVGPMLAARRVIVPIAVQDGWINVAPEATQDAGGTAKLNLYTTFDQPQKINVQAKLTDWLTPIPLQDMTGRTSADVDLNVDAKSLSADGKLSVAQQISINDDTIGDTTLNLHASGRSVAIDSITGQILGGTAYGQGSVDLDAPQDAELWAGITGMSLNRLKRIAPQLGDVKGLLSARLHAHPADGPHPLGPMQVDANVDSQNATYKAIQIGNMNVTLFADKDRVALNDDPKVPNEIAIAGGVARVWGRLSRVPAIHGGPPQPSVFVSVALDQLDTDQLNRIIDPDGKPVPGRLSGSIAAYGNPLEIRRLDGQGNFTIEKSDLANIGLFAVLYNAMHLGFGTSKPDGSGELAFRLVNGRLDITRLSYFNRGVFAKGVVTADDVLKLKQSPIHGYLLGTFRPLKDIKLPFFGTLDGALDALQRGATTLRISGTIANVQAEPVTLHDVSSDLRNIVVGEAEAK